MIVRFDIDLYLFAQLLPVGLATFRRLKSGNHGHLGVNTGQVPDGKASGIFKEALLLLLLLKRHQFCFHFDDSMEWSK